MPYSTPGPHFARSEYRLRGSPLIRGPCIAALWVPALRCIVKNAAPRPGHGTFPAEKEQREGSEKALPHPRRSSRARKTGDIPTPPRATTKLFEPPCVTTSPAPGETGELECADTSRPAPIANPIVNLTLTAQRRRRPAENTPAAWTLQSLSCTTKQGNARARKRDRCVPPSQVPGQGRV
jgi:hypothetical protein